MPRVEARESHRGKSTASTMTRVERTRHNCDRDTPVRATQLRNERRRLFRLFAVRTTSLFAAFVSFERSSVDQLSLVRDFLSSVVRSIDPRPIDDIAATFKPPSTFANLPARPRENDRSACLQASILPNKTTNWSQSGESQRAAGSTSGRQLVIGPCESPLLRARACPNGWQSWRIRNLSLVGRKRFARKLPALVNIFYEVRSGERDSKERSPLVFVPFLVQATIMPHRLRNGRGGGSLVSRRLFAFSQSSSE